MKLTWTQCPDCWQPVTPRADGKAVCKFCGIVEPQTTESDMPDDFAAAATKLIMSDKKYQAGDAGRVLTSPTPGNGHGTHAQDGDALTSAQDVKSILQSARPLTYRTSWTAAELLAATFPPPRCILPGVIPQGGAVSIGGRPKIGKSWWALQLAIADASGGRFLDLDIEQGRVLYLALEDSPRRLQDRLTFLHAPMAIDGLSFALEWEPLNGADGLNKLHARITADKLNLVIIDTLARSTTALDWNDVGATTAVIGQLQRMAMTTDSTIVMLDHHRKTNGFEADVIDDIMGSTGKSAVIDTALGLYRKRGDPDATLRATGRDILDVELVLTFRADVGWVLKGDAREVAKSQAEDEALAAIQALGEADAAAIAKEAGKTRQAVSTALKELERRGVIHSRIVPAKSGGAVKILYAVLPSVSE